MTARGDSFNPISGTYLYNPSLMNGSDIFMNTDDVSLNYEKMLDSQPIPTKTTLPNADIDDLGLKNRKWSLKGYINLHEEKSAANTIIIDVASLGSIFTFTGSLFFSDGAVAPSGTQNIWIKPRNCRIQRTSEYGDSFWSIGHVLTYTMEVEETI